MVGTRHGSDDVKDRLAAEVDRRADVLVEASHQIHAHPELGFEEHFAHDLLTASSRTTASTSSGSAYGLDTAFAARAGTDGPDHRRAVRVRRPARHRPRLRAQHHRRRRARRRPGRGRAGRRARRPGASSSARRPRRAAAARC